MGTIEEEQNRKAYWNAVDEQLTSSITDSQKIFRTNYWINLIVVAVGLVLVGFSLAQSITQGTSVATLTYAGLGITDFVALFLVNPQTRLMMLLGDIGQIALVYKTWNQQNQIIDNAIYDQSRQAYRETQPDRIMPYIEEYAKIREEALTAILSIEKGPGTGTPATTPATGST